MKYNYGQVVKIKPLAATGRHDDACPYAVLLDDGAETTGGDERYKAVFVNDLDQPTTVGLANLYASEIEELLPEANPQPAFAAYRALWQEVKSER